MKNFWNKKIPTLLGFFLIASGILLTSYLAQKGILPFINAAPSETPTNIRITNMTDSSFTITYKTADSITGTISYGTNAGMGQIALDDRDQKSGRPQDYQIHSITLRQLTASTNYYYSIISGTTTFLNNNKPFILKTGPTIYSSPSDIPPISGRIITPDGNNAIFVIVFVKTITSQLLSTLTNNNGLYILPINTIRTSDLKYYEKIEPSNKFDLLVNNNNLLSTILWGGDTSKPIPLITIGNNYDFIVSSSPIASTSALPLGFPQFTLDQSLNATPVIITPTNNETFTDAQPLFAGKATPNSVVNITIHSSDIITTKVKADTQGNWIYRPSTPLAPGQHTIAMSTIDNNGIIKTIIKTFTIFASGTQVAEAATPSATLAPSATPTVTLTPTPTIIPTISSSNIISPTQNPKTLPATGSSSGIMLGLLGLLGSATGIILFLASRGTAL